MNSQRYDEKNEVFVSRTRNKKADRIEPAFVVERIDCYLRLAPRL